MFSKDFYRVESKLQQGGVTHESLYLGLHSIVHESRRGRRITLSGPSKGRGSSPRVPMAIIVTSTSP